MKWVETVVFRKVQAARSRNTLRPVCVVIGSLTIPSWGAQAWNVCMSLVLKEPVPYMSWDLPIYRLYMPTLLLL